jgi:cerevisin
LNEYLKRHAPAKLLHFYEIGSFKGYSIQLPSAADQNSNDQLEDALDDLRYSASIEVIEQDYLCQGSAIQSNAPWNLDRITKRSRNQMDSKYYYPDKAGAGVNVYILDTGVRITHEQFQGRARFGASFITRPSAGDPHGHGTAVAGVVASAVYGVAKAANIISVQVSNASNYATWSDVIAGLDWYDAFNP